MHICCTDMQRMGGFRLPKLFMVSGYTVYFWSRENDEPIHVHISKGKPTPNATKFGLQGQEDVFWQVMEVGFLIKN